MKCPFNESCECTKECMAYDDLDENCLLVDGRMDLRRTFNRQMKEMTEAIDSVANAIFSINEGFNTPEVGKALEGLGETLAVAGSISEVAGAISDLKGDE